MNNKIFNPLEWANKNNSVDNKVNNAEKGCESSVDNIGELVNAIVSNGRCITDDYNDWLKVGFALAGALGEGGRQYFHQLSSMSSKYNQTECDKKYNNCLRSSGNGVNIETLYWMAGNAGINLSELAREQLSNESINGQSFKSFKASSTKNIEKDVKNGVLGGLDNEMTLEALKLVKLSGDKATNGYTFSDKLEVDNLDHILRTILDQHHGDAAKCDAMILGALNVISGLMGGANGSTQHRSGIYGVYDGRRVYAPLFNIIYSGAGNEKGNLVFAKMLAWQIKKEMRRTYEAEKQDYDRAMAEWEAKGKKERGEAPKEPAYRDPFVPGNSSSSAVYRALDANGGWGMMFETEADTVSSMIDSDYGNYSDLMRKAHHHETLSMNRVTEKVHIDIDEPRLSILLTCTPGQLPNLFPSFENGLGSRFLFYNMPDDVVEFHDVFALKDTPLEDIYKKLGDELLPLFHAMQQRVDHPIQFVMSQTQQQEFIRTYKEILQEQFGMLGKGIRAFVFRIALECFRYAMILTTLRRLSSWRENFNGSAPEQLFKDEENALVCDDRDFNTAMTIVGCLINHTARVYAVLAKEDDNPFVSKNTKLSADEIKMYKALPEGEFPCADAMDIAYGMGFSRSKAQRIISKLCNVCRLINTVRHGVYFKSNITDEETV